MNLILELKNQKAEYRMQMSEERRIGVDGRVKSARKRLLFFYFYKDLRAFSGGAEISNRRFWA